MLARIAGPRLVNNNAESRLGIFLATLIFLSMRGLSLLSVVYDAAGRDSIDLVHMLLVEVFLDIAFSQAEALRLIDEVAEEILDISPSVEVPESPYAMYLSALGYCDDKIPKEFICCITYDIMTDPVFDPRCPKIKFDRPAIIAHLTRYPRHPITREPLTTDMLVSDIALKATIKAFYKHTVREHFAYKASTPRISTTFLKQNYFLFKQVIRTALIEQRHESREAQHAYDMRFGIVKHKSQP